MNGSDVKPESQAGTPSSPSVSIPIAEERDRLPVLLTALRQIANPSPHNGGWQGLAIWMRNLAEDALGEEAVTDQKIADDFRSSADEIKRLNRLVEAYRLCAVNEGWSHALCNAYGYKEYTRQRIITVDEIASRTVSSGYDAAGYLRDHSKGEEL